VIYKLSGRAEETVLEMDKLNGRVKEMVVEMGKLSEMAV